jgi:hypothetical protein
MSMLRWTGLLLVGLLPATVTAQEAESREGFAVLRGSDTVAVEEFARGPVELTGTLLRGTATAGGDRVRYRAVLVDDQSAPLIDLSVWRSSDDTATTRPRQTSRVIFRDDSVAVDDMTGSGLRTLILPTQRTAIPFLHLSVAFMELATRRAAAATADSVAMPFFNLGGGQTIMGHVRRLGADSAIVALGTVEFRVQVDPAGRILGGALPAQGLRILRRGAP